ncbi:MAG: high frequency lysogenization protein HflD [Gammaproteobacteria bacterium]
MSRREDRALALAGVFQAAKLVHAVAWQGVAVESAVEATLGSLFRFDAPDTVGVYGGVTYASVGLRTLAEQLAGEAPPSEAPVMRYTLGLLHLERRVDASDTVWEKLRTGLLAAERQHEAFGIAHENTVSALAALYGDLISPTGPRILVEGETSNLRDTRKASLIRALLLGGIRSAVLWRQLGATRWSLLFSRRRLIDDAHTWLNAL